MNKKIKIIIIVILIVLVIINILEGLKFISYQKSNEKYGDWITDNEFLYDKAIEYLKEENLKTAKDINEQDYLDLYDYNGFGIKEKANKKYAYMYILNESYFVRHNKIRSSQGSSMPYKFIFENNEVIGYEIPRDGAEYKSSIKEMFPDDIENKVLNYNYNSNIVNNYNKLKEHYAYLGTANGLIVHSDEGERAIAVYGCYGKSSNKSEANTIKGKYIDGYGDIFEYTIPCNENQELLVKIDDIDKAVIEKYKGNQIGSILKEDLETLMENMKNMDYEYKNIDNDDKLSFVKVLHIKNNGNLLKAGYNNDDFITLIENTENVKEENVSKQSQNIINILKKYEMT